MFAMSNLAAMSRPLAPKKPSAGGVPLLGHLLEFRRDRFELAQVIGRERTDLVSMRMGFFTILMASSGRVAHEVLVEKADDFVKSRGLSVFARPLLGDGLLTSEHAAHKRQRRMLAPVFAHKRIAAYGDVMVQKTLAAAERIALSRSRAGEGLSMDLAEEMMRLTLEIVGKALFDAELAGEASAVGEALTVAMRQMMDAMVRLVPTPPKVPTPGNLRLARAVRQLDDVVYGIIRERRSSGVDRGDMLGMLLATRDADDGSGLEDREVRDQAMTILLAGHETTANALAWTFDLLGRHSDVREKVEREVDAVLQGRAATLADLPNLPYSLSVIKESMRLYPPAYMIGRRALREVTIGGARVEKGQVVIINVIGIHRRGDVFADPDRFDPERFTPEREKALPPNAYIPFGAGPRVCIGNHFALMEAHLVLATMCQGLRFNLVSSVPRETDPLVTLRPKGGVWVHVEPR
jgi:cytochrome P450